MKFQTLSNDFYHMNRHKETPEEKVTSNTVIPKEYLLIYIVLHSMTAIIQEHLKLYRN